MARLNNGILGSINGKVGNVEGYVRYGKAYLRTKKRKSKVPPTINRLTCRKRMSVVNNFVNSMTDYVRIGFEGAADGKPFSPNNAAKSYQLRNALQGEYPEISIFYPGVRLTQGSIENPANTKAVVEGNGIRFTWDYHPVFNWDDRRAQVMLLVYIEESGKAISLLSGARYTEMTEFMEMPADVKGLNLHAYLSFIADDRKNISNSIYLGNHVL
ncbi:hypothetical protein SAMN04487898_10380 [Pedobacter sp. ok626]|uniref:DUF6266 family protein n=1 Tax=Pedobacter sp. ok626 TaxID=1761882 RepID=UPI0008871602|nr:DUF6266 family protein [Pedobacter sp. ok626]SDJ49417.1 hypothetical protein SAMN04487898_10380 [Pedobacter sp. ok626]